jgi:hypothetical protein
MYAIGQELRNSLNTKPNAARTMNMFSRALSLFMATCRALRRYVRRSYGSVHRFAMRGEGHGDSNDVKPLSLNRDTPHYQHRVDSSDGEASESYTVALLECFNVRKAFGKYITAGVVLLTVRSPAPSSSPHSPPTVNSEPLTQLYRVVVRATVYPVAHGGTAALTRPPLTSAACLCRGGIAAKGRQPNPDAQKGA